MDASLEIVLADYQEPLHAQAVVQLMEHYARDPMGGGAPLSEFARRNMVQTLESFPTAFSLLAFVQGRAVGLANCIESLSTFACRPLVNVHDLVVLEPYRGMGTGVQLLRGVEREARARGCCKLTLEVLEGNVRAKVLYRKFGFQAYRLDPAMGQALFLEKAL